MEAKVHYQSFLLLTACVTFLFVSTKFVSCSRIQMLTLYTDNGNYENYTRDIPDLTKVSRIVQRNRLGSICSQLGVWAFFTTKSYDDSSSFGYHPATTQWTCDERRVSAYMTPYRSIRHVGNINLDESGISLFSEPFFAREELYFNGEALSLSSPFEMKSFGFTGPQNWTIFSGVHFTGDGICLCSENYKYLSETGSSDGESGTGSGSSGVTFEERLTFVVSSLRKGCYGSQVWLLNGEFVKPKQYFNDTFGQKYLDSLEALKLHPISNSATFFIAGTQAEVNLPSSQMFDAFLTQLDSTWTAYKEPNFKGQSLCLKARQRLSSSFSRIGSIKHGCGHESTADSDSDEPMTSMESSSSTETTVTVTAIDSATDAMTTSSTESLDFNTIEGAGRSFPFETTEVPTTFETGAWPLRTRVTAKFGVMELGESEYPNPSTLPPTPAVVVYSVTDQGWTSLTTLSTPPSTTTRDRGGRNFPFPNGPTHETNGRPRDSIDEMIINAYNNGSNRLGNQVISRNRGDNVAGNGENSNHNDNHTLSERISTADTSSVFFTAFIITLILLILCIILAIGIFVYFRQTRNAHLEPLPRRSPSPITTTSGA